jgi:iron complex transport system substrate-binding protein
MHFGQIANNYLAIKRGTPADQIIRWAGGVNAIDSTGGMLRLTPELIAKAAPDVIIATDVGYDRVGSPEKFAELPGVSLTPAGKAKRIYRVDETEVMYYGPRTPATLEKVAHWLHANRQPEQSERAGTRFSGCAPAGAPQRVLRLFTEQSSTHSVCPRSLRRSAG